MNGQAPPDNLARDEAALKDEMRAAGIARGHHPDFVGRFLARTQMDPTPARPGLSPCLLWTAGRTGAGYGTVWHDGRDRNAHRLACEVFRGDIPAGLIVRHVCDRPECVRPDHLALGSRKDNADDRISRHGPGLPGVPLSAEERRVARAMSAQGWSQAKIAGVFGVTRQTAGRAIRNVTTATPADAA